MSDPTLLRFGSFELDPISGELRHNGDPVKLQPQPLKVLEALVRRSGQIVTRADIRDRVWHGDTFVDFEQGLNFCIRQIREALGDTADAPRFIETLPRRGYRFLAPLKTDVPTPAAPRAAKEVARLIVLPFRMLRPDPETEFLAFSLPDALTTSLVGLKSLVVRSSQAAARFAPDADPKAIAAEAAVDFIVTGTLLRAGEEVRVSAQLTDAESGTLLAAHTAQTTVGHLFRVLDDLASRIVAALALSLTGAEQRALGRDVPANGPAYEFFLRGNQYSYDPKQWGVARDLYLRAVEEDPGYAPAWARLGRIHHVMAKYLDTGHGAGLADAEAALHRALALNPDLPLAHKLLAQLEVDLGRAHDAMVRLAERAQCADPELLVGLVSACRYCGLLDGSVSAHDRAVVLDAKVRTSVPHTWFMQANHAKVATVRLEDYPYIVPMSLAELGRGDEALPVLRELEQKTKTRLREFIIAARTLLENDHAGSIAAVNRIVSSDFRDPEGLFYLSRHLAHLGEVGPALGLFERVVAGGFFCYPTMATDPWLAPLRKRAAFTKLLRHAEARHRDALEAFSRRLGGQWPGVGS